MGAHKWELILRKSKNAVDRTRQALQPYEGAAPGRMPEDLISQSEAANDYDSKQWKAVRNESRSEDAEYLHFHDDSALHIATIKAYTHDEMIRRRLDEDLS
jgi:hypothetical protein